MIIPNFFNLEPRSLIFWLLISFLFFLLIREIVTWYWKINKIAALLEKIEQNTRKTVNTENK
jgi:hypothetical protein